MYKYDLLNKYNLWIYQLFLNIKNSKSEDDIDNYDLAKIFELYSCIKLSVEHDKLFYHYDDIDPSFKEDNQLSQNDTGIDACNLIDSLVQVKLRKDTLNWSECSNFFGSSNMFCPILNKVIIRWPKLIISRNIESKLSKNLLQRSKLFIDKTYNRSEIIDYCNLLLNNPPLLENKEDIKIELRDYQIEAINLINTNNKNIIICIPTGCGKNIIILNSFEKNKKYLIFVPRIILLDQLKDEIIRYFPYLKSNIQTIGDGTNKFNSNKQITICVFNSVNIVEPYIKEFNKIYIDEAHHIIKPQIYNEDDDDDDEEDNDNTINYINIIKSFQKYNNNIYLSATIDKYNNFIFYKKDIRDMINNNYLTDYTLHVPIFNNDPTNKNICEYLINKYLHLILYCNSQKEGKELNILLNQLQKGCSEYIDCNTSKKKRNIIINKYKEGKLKFLVNVKILVEGFNAPITKGVCFIHLPSSKTTLIQIIGRALRLHPEKTIANIILPYSTENDEKNINNFLKIIASNDSRIKKSYLKQDLGGYININKSNDYNKLNECKKDKQNIIEFRYEQIFNHIGECLSKNIVTPEEKGKLLLEYVNKEGKVPSTNYIYKIKDEYNNETEINLGSFYDGLKKGKNKNILKDLIEKNNIIKEDIIRYNKDKENKKDFTPEEKGKILLEYVSEKNSLPVFNYIYKIKNEYNNETEIKLGYFYNHLKQGHNKEILEDLIKKNNIIKEDIIRYNKDKEHRKKFTPNEKSKLLLEYVNKEGKVPSHKYIHKIKDEYNNEIKIKLGKFFDGLKQGKNKKILKDLINKNNIIKKYTIKKYNKKK